MEFKAAICSLFFTFDVMNKALYIALLSALIVVSCDKRSPIIGKWRYATFYDSLSNVNLVLKENGTGSLEYLTNNKIDTITKFKYEVKNDSFFYYRSPRFLLEDKSKIIKIDKDSLVFGGSEGSYVPYYRLP